MMINVLIINKLIIKIKSQKDDHKNVLCYGFKIENTLLHYITSRFILMHVSPVRTFKASTGIERRYYDECLDDLSDHYLNRILRNIHICITQRQISIPSYRQLPVYLYYCDILRTLCNNFLASNIAVNPCNVPFSTIT